MKKCTRCNNLKHLSEFGLRKRSLKDRVVWRYMSICKNCNSEISKIRYYKMKEEGIKYIYRFLNEDGDVIYIGKTENLIYRINSHFSNGHLSQKCYEEVKLIQYIPMSSSILMDIKEIYYINIYKPRYNNNYIANEPAFIIREFTSDKWINYDKDEIKKIKKDTSTKFFNIYNEFITSIFSREINGKYFVYVEYKEYDELYRKNKKRQLSKGSFATKEEANNLVKELKILYGKNKD